MEFTKQLLKIQNIFQLDECSKEKYGIVVLIVLLIMILLLYYYPHPSNDKPQNKKLVLIGQAGVGKTKIFNIASEKQIKRKENENEISSFYEFNIGNNLDLVDTPSIEFEITVELREQIIEKFTRYFKQYFCQIQQFYIVVNFERTDLMKNKILATLKYFQKFKSMVSIIITQFQLSEDQEQDQQILKKDLSLFVNNPQNIYFINDDIQSEKLKQLFIKHNQMLDYKDTIFEELDQNEIKQNFKNIQQIVVDGKQYQSIQLEQ